jgi:hypothetical protein
MNIYGYPIQHRDNHAESLQLAEITLCATPNELRQISEFLVSCATEMERMGDAYDHLHLGDQVKEFNNSSPHFVVAKA